MGRYYQGDIEGKFWFGVQDSSDAEFFGAAEAEPNYIEYHIPSDCKDEDVKEGIKECLKELGNWKERLDQFFEQTRGYNDDMIIKYWKEKHDEVINADAIRRQLEWYARLSLGRKIQKFFEDNPESDCNFTAEP